MARRASRRAAAPSRTVSVDFKGVDWEKGGGGAHIKPGEYLGVVESVEEQESAAGNPMLKWVFKGAEGAAKGKTFWYYTVLAPDPWNLGKLLDALGQEIPDSALDVDLDELVDQEIIMVIDDEEYQGKVKSKMVDFMSVDSVGEAGDKEPVKATGRKKGKELPKLVRDEVTAMNEDELTDVVDKYSLDVDLSEFKTPRRKAAAVIAELEEKELLEEEEDTGEDPTPAPATRRGRRAAK